MSGLLRNSADWRTLGFVGSFFACLALLWNVALPVWLWAPVYAWLLLMAMVASVINHNALHTPIFRNARLNRAMQVLLTLIYGMPVTLFVPVHNLSHHKHSQTQKDVLRSSKLRFKSNLLNVLLASSVLGMDTLRDDFRYFAAQRRRGARINGQLRLEIASLALYVIALVVLDWRLFLLLAFLPAQLSQLFIVGINFVQHDGCDPRNDGLDFARNFTGPVFNWFFLNNGYHTVHHLHPGLHWSASPREHEQLVAPFIHPALVAPRADLFFWDYFIAPGTRRLYTGEPYFPAEAGQDEPWFYDSNETYSAAEPTA